MYDTHLGQFLNADPIILDEQNSQNFALYSYVLNNPLKYTDPSGYTQQGGPASAAIAGQTGKMLQMQLLETNNNINAIKEGAEQPFFLANGILYIPTTGGATFTYGNGTISYDGYLRETLISGSRSVSRSGSNSNGFQFKSVSHAYYQLDFGGRGGGGGSDKDIYLGIAGGVVSAMELSYLNDSKQILKYGQLIDGKVRSAETLTRANRISSTATAKYLGYAGKALGFYSTWDAGKKFINDPVNPANWVKLGANGGMLLMKANPFAFTMGVGYTILEQGGYIDDWFGVKP